MFKLKRAQTVPPVMPVTACREEGDAVMLTHGLTEGTKVASNIGWQRIETLSVGDVVLTFDRGLQEIVEVRRSTIIVDLGTPEGLRPIVVPTGALDNRKEIVLLPDQNILLESELAQDRHGDPFALLPVAALVGVRGIHRRARAAEFEMIAVHFAQEELVYVEGGTLVHCPRRVQCMSAFLGADTGAYDLLANTDAAALAACFGNSRN